MFPQLLISTPKPGDELGEAHLPHHHGLFTGLRSYWKNWKIIEPTHHSGGIGVVQAARDDCWTTSKDTW
jgi:hypothetical protein